MPGTLLSFVYTSSLNLLKNSMGLELPPFYRWANWGRVAVSTLTKATELVRAEPGSKPQQPGSRAKALDCTMLPPTTASAATVRGGLKEHTLPLPVPPRNTVLPGWAAGWWQCRRRLTAEDSSLFQASSDNDRCRWVFGLWSLPCLPWSVTRKLRPRTPLAQDLCPDNWFIHCLRSGRSWGELMWNGWAYQSTPASIPLIQRSLSMQGFISLCRCMVSRGGHRTQGNMSSQPHKMMRHLRSENTIK